MGNKKWLTQDAFLLSLSAFFADLGYQAVTALFPIFLVLRLHQSIIVYGIITGLSFGIGSFFALAGGKAGDRFNKKYVAILGNLFIPLMSLSALFTNVWAAGILFVLGWWARYFRTPARRALLVEVSDPKYRSKIFGFLHGMDIGGGMLAVFGALFFLFLKIPIHTIILLTAIPLFISTLVLLFVKLDKKYPLYSKDTENKANAKNKSKGLNWTFIALLLAATLYGFSFYNLGFPILTVSQSTKSAIPGVLIYAVYLGISAIAGYALGSMRLKPLRSLWELGYLPSALASLAIGITYLFHLSIPIYYLAVAVLGMGMGAVETYEPTLASLLIDSQGLSEGMGLLSASRGIGQFLSNVIMGILFTFGEFNSYFYAFLASFLASLVLFIAEKRLKKLP